MIESLKPVIQAQPFFHGFSAAMTERIVGCAENVRFVKDDYLLREGQPANEFFVIRSGRVMISIHGVQLGTLTVQTIEPGEMIGWSWLVPPYRARFDAIAVEETRALRFDGQCLRGKCDEDPHLGYEVLKRVSSMLAQRLEDSRIQLMDLYGRKQGA